MLSYFVNRGPGFVEILNQLVQVVSGTSMHLLLASTSRHWLHQLHILTWMQAGAAVLGGYSI